MYKGIHNNSELNINPIDIKMKQEEQKEKQDTNSKGYETIRRQVRGTNKPIKNMISQILFINGRNYR